MAVLGVGKALSLVVVAEGIEEQSQLTTLEDMGCRRAQGFLFGKPSPAGAIGILLDPSRRVERLVHQPYGAPHRG
jgi:EAL domain-containing protein (putative c-di-GMP-specific phosphodiesterase class I)